MYVRVAGSGSSGNSYVLHLDDGSWILLDMGCPYPAIQRAAEYKAPSKCLFGLVTHEHKDHCSMMEQYCKKGIKVFCNTAVNRKLGLGRILYPMQPLLHRRCWITPFEVPHTTKDEITGEMRGCQNYGYLIELPTHEKLLYVTDFEYIKYTFKKQAINYFILECNHVDENVDGANRTHVLKGHSSLDTVKKFLSENFTPYMRNVILCHLSNDNADALRMKKEVQDVVGDTVQVDIATKGAKIELAQMIFRSVK